MMADVMSGRAPGIDLAGLTIARYPGASGVVKRDACVAGEMARFAETGRRERRASAEPAEAGVAAS